MTTCNAMRTRTSISSSAAVSTSGSGGNGTSSAPLANVSTSSAAPSVLPQFSAPSALSSAVLPYVVLTSAVSASLFMKKNARRKQLDELETMRANFGSAAAAATSAVAANGSEIQERADADGDDEEEDAVYKKKAAAEVRMTQHIYSAMIFMRYSQVASLVTELNLALYQNDICQAALIMANFQKVSVIQTHSDSSRVRVESWRVGERAGDLTSHTADTVYVVIRRLIVAL